ncbi:MAG: CoA-binding protein [Rhodospirillales bacterium]|nr:CoA-binding protein [Rhodospirillales bacterium]
MTAPVPDSDSLLRDILTSVRTVAIVGASPDPGRPSHRIMRFLGEKGYAVIPVNPRGGGRILGKTVYARLADVPGPIDMVDIFRASDAAGAVADEAVALAPTKGIRVIWMQLGVRDDAAARRAEEHGLTVVMDRCVSAEYRRLVEPGRRRSAS